MARDASLIISAKDNCSATLLKIQKNTTAYRKDLTQLSKELDRFNSTKVTLKTDLTKAKNELSAAQKAFKGTGDEAARLQLESAQANYDNIKSNLDMVSKAAKKTERDMQNLTGTMSKTETRAANTGGAFSKLAEAGLFAMAGRAVGDLGGSLAKSAFGSEIGNAISTVLSGAATGAAIGSVIPGLGTAVGGAVGAATGLIQSATAMFETRDDAFRTSVQSLYEDIIGGRAEQVTTGSGIAGTREQRQIAFSTLLGGEDKAEKFLSEMRQFAAVTPFSEDTLAAMSRTLLAYNYTADKIQPLLTAIGDAGSALGLAPEDLNWVAASLGKMNTTGKTTLEYLNPLLERGIPVFDYLAEATGKSNKQVQEMISKGLIPGQDAAKVIADYMGFNFAGNMEKQSQTYQGMVSTLEDLQTSVDAAMGEGFNEERKKGLEDQIDYLEGAGGDKMKEANSAIGAYEASLQNKQEELLRNAMDDAWKQIDEEGITDAAEQGRILQEAKANAAIEYANTTEFQEQQAAQNALIDRIQDTMSPEYYNAGLVLGQNLTQGILAAYNELHLPSPVSGVDAHQDYGGVQPTGAYGFATIPYDGFPIIAHQGEKLLTAGQARRGEGQGGVTITGNTFHVREEADIDRVASALYEKIYLTQQGYVGEAG